MGVEDYRLPRNKAVLLSALDPEDTGGFSSKADVAAEVEKLKERLGEQQDMLFAQKEHALLVILQGMDCSGKDGVIKHALSGVNPQGFNAVSFKRPTPEELGHDFLWRVHRNVPAKGSISAFNRSHYEDVLVPVVHGTIAGKEIRRRFGHINHFEELLTDQGTTIVKIFLHISKEFQINKIEKRLEDPSKRWKFDSSDLAERAYWEQYQAAYEQIFEQSNKEASPWYWVPANHRWYRDYLVLRILVRTLDKLNLRYPQ